MKKLRTYGHPLFARPRTQLSLEQIAELQIRLPDQDSVLTLIDGFRGLLLKSVHRKLRGLEDTPDLQEQVFDELVAIGLAAMVEALAAAKYEKPEDVLRLLRRSIENAINRETGRRRKRRETVCFDPTLLDIVPAPDEISDHELLIPQIGKSKRERSILRQATEDKSYREIAESEGVSPDQIYRDRQRMRRRAEQWGLSAPPTRPRTKQPRVLRDAPDVACPKFQGHRLQSSGGKRRLPGPKPETGLFSQDFRPVRMKRRNKGK